MLSESRGIEYHAGSGFRGPSPEAKHYTNITFNVLTSCPIRVSSISAHLLSGIRSLASITRCTSSSNIR